MRQVFDRVVSLRLPIYSGLMNRIELESADELLTRVYLECVCRYRPQVSLFNVQYYYLCVDEESGQLGVHVALHERQRQ